MIGRRDPFADPRELIDRLYAYVAYLVGDGPDAEDVTSEAFERGLRYRDSFDPKRGTALSWLIGIARRCLADRALRGPATTSDEELADRPAPRRDEGETATTLTVRAVVARLGERDRELVALRYGADLTAREIGALLRLQTNAVEVALHRIHRRLRSDLAVALDPEAAAAEIGRKGLGLEPGM